MECPVLELVHVGLRSISTWNWFVALPYPARVQSMYQYINKFANRRSERNPMSSAKPKSNNELPPSPKSKQISCNLSWPCRPRLYQRSTSFSQVYASPLNSTYPSSNWRTIRWGLPTMRFVEHLKQAALSCAAASLCEQSITSTKWCRAHRKSRNQTLCYQLPCCVSFIACIGRLVKFSRDSLSCDGHVEAPGFPLKICSNTSATLCGGAWSGKLRTRKTRS